MNHDGIFHVDSCFASTTQRHDARWRTNEFSSFQANRPCSHRRQIIQSTADGRYGWWNEACSKSPIGPALSLVFFLLLCRIGKGCRSLLLTKWLCKCSVLRRSVPRLFVQGLYSPVIGCSESMVESVLS
jgi:hypothetical protein